MTRVLVRAIGVFGKYDQSNSAWDDDCEGVFEDKVIYSFERIEGILREKGKSVVGQQINLLPYIDEGIITGPNAGSIYLFNNCLVANCFVSGNGFNFDGAIQTLVSAGLSEEEIEKTFSYLKFRVSGYVPPDIWFNNLKFKKEVNIPNVPKGLRKNIEEILKLEPKLLGIE